MSMLTRYWAPQNLHTFPVSTVGLYGFYLHKTQPNVLRFQNTEIGQYPYSSEKRSFPTALLLLPVATSYATLNSQIIIICLWRPRTRKQGPKVSFHLRGQEKSLFLPLWL